MARAALPSCCLQPCRLRSRCGVLDSCRLLLPLPPSFHVDLPSGTTTTKNDKDDDHNNKNKHQHAEQQQEQPSLRRGQQRNQHLHPQAHTTIITAKVRTTTITTTATTTMKLFSVGGMASNHDVELSSHFIRKKKCTAARSRAHRRHVLADAASTFLTRSVSSISLHKSFLLLELDHCDWLWVRALAIGRDDMRIIVNP